MGIKTAVTVRFCMEGDDAELYRKIQDGKDGSGLSLSEYVKKVLMAYFEDAEKRNGMETVLQEVREGYRDIARRMERMICSSIREHDAILLGALNKMGAAAAASGNPGRDENGFAELPEESGSLPEGALDFLNKS